MKREMNKNEFLYARRCMNSAQELMNDGLYAQAIVELKPAQKLLERDSEPTRMLGLLYEMKAVCMEAIGNLKGQTQNLRAALHIFRSIQDVPKTDQISRQLEKTEKDNPGCQSQD